MTENKDIYCSKLCCANVKSAVGCAELQAQQKLDFATNWDLGIAVLIDLACYLQVITAT